MNNTRRCRCGRRKHEDRPACHSCWADYLTGGSPTEYVPETDGVLIPEEATVEWQAMMVRGLGRSPFHDD
jgi:hypothetical protein